MMSRIDAPFSRALTSLALLLFIVLLAPGNPALAAEEVKDTLGEHVVQPGDTLQSITRKYLGDPMLWRENWRLNPDIEDPDFLSIGMRLTVIKERKIEARSAQISDVSNEVQKNVQRSEWIGAIRGDRLLPLDGVRTLRNSSARLQFNDNSSLRMTEYSQVFLERRETTLRNVDRSRIEVVKGSAELVFEPITRQETDIELVTGPSVTRPQPTSQGEARLRTSADESGGAKVMVYSGSSEVSAGGASVRVGAGLGTAVPESGPPSPPEKLLGSPSLESPADGAVWPVANGVVSWRPLNNAASYTVEICADAGCDQLIARKSRVEQTSWDAEVDRAGDFYWRVTAVSASGLEGYPSRARSLEVLSTIIDRQGPVSAVIPEGYFKHLDGQRLLVADQTRLRLTARDDAVEVAGIEFSWDGENWQIWRGEPVTLAGQSLPATLQVRATDTLGKQGPVAEVSFSGTE